MDRNAFNLDVVVGRGDAKQLPSVDAAAHDMTHDEIVFGDLHPDLVAPRSSDPEDLGGLLHSFTVQRHTRNGRVVRNKVFRAR